MPPIEPNEEEREEKLAEDGQTPFSPADDEINEELDDTHPSTDTDVQAEGIYQDGLANEVGASEPNAGNQVVSYDPEAEEDSRDGAS